MFGGHIWELVIFLVIALVIFGPKRLPEIGGAMGKGIREFRKGTSEIEDKTPKVDPHVDVASRPTAVPRDRDAS